MGSVMFTKSRLIALGTAALGAAALVAALVVPATTASASVSSVPKGVWNYIWKPGTPLPKIAAGEKLEAWPVYPPGAAHPATTPMVLIATTTSTGKVIMTASAAAIRGVTSNGTVNLLAEPDRCEPLSSTWTNLGQRSTVVGEAFSTTNNAQMSFTYQHDQSSSLGVGISSYATKDWSADGTESISRTSSFFENFGWQSHKNRVRYETKFRYSRERFICVAGIGESSEFYIVKAWQWAGGAVLARAGAAPKASHGNCVPQAKGSSAGLDSTTAFTFAAGFTVVAFTGEATTGYDTNTQITFAFPWGGAYLCGLRDPPGGPDPKLLFAQPKG
jgi:hypothetical protein